MIPTLTKQPSKLVSSILRGLTRTETGMAIRYLSVKSLFFMQGN